MRMLLPRVVPVVVEVEGVQKIVSGIESALWVDWLDLFRTGRG